MRSRIETKKTIVSCSDHQLCQATCARKRNASVNELGVSTCKLDYNINMWEDTVHTILVVQCSYYLCVYTHTMLCSMCMCSYYLVYIPNNRHVCLSIMRYMYIYMYINVYLHTPDRCRNGCDQPTGDRCWWLVECPRVRMLQSNVMLSSYMNIKQTHIKNTNPLKEAKHKNGC